jgi:hypothetical protein
MCPQGDTEVDIMCSAVSPSSQRVVWESVTTAIILNPKRSKPQDSKVGLSNAHAGWMPRGSCEQTLTQTWHTSCHLSCVLLVLLRDLTLLQRLSLALPA